MNIEGKQRLLPLAATDMEQLSQRLAWAEDSVQRAFHALADAVACEQVRYLLEDKYRLGRLEAVYEIFGGYVNRSFGAVVTQDGARREYFVRKYKKDATDEDIRVEHALIAYAVSHGMDALSGVISAPGGETFVRLTDFVTGKAESRAFAVYDFLPGEDRHDWINNDLTPAEDASMGALLAKFHDCTAGFDPGQKAEPPIVQFLPVFAARFPHVCDALPAHNRFRALWEQHLPQMLSVCRESEAFLTREDINPGMTLCPCHCDFHPGNVKWSGAGCTAVFDLDWAKLDMRLFDVAYAALYTCASWDSASNGRVSMRRVGIFLRGYDDYLRLRGSGRLPRFTQAEKEAFPHMMRAGLMYLFNWCSSYCTDANGLNEFEYFYYLSHCVNALRDLSRHDAALKRAISF